ncbi:hypothetical protein L9F63_014432 [Diploptera punctata]|uniref:Centrosomal protein of 162 kDa n=1 Tax=Diploptera punctata TaxID=6984 RepID=A0AAD8EL27_DIPPU|nr:hypothetical protein L9F63_014432 [Diploptera punctata]
MSDLDLQFEEFLKEPLSTTDESPDTNSSPKQTDMKTKLPEPRTFWWMKPKVPTEPFSCKSSLSSTSIDEKLDSPQVDSNFVPTSPSPKSGSMKPRASVSPDISSSMAEFLEKEKYCKELSSSISEVDSPGMDLDDVTDDDIGSIMEQLSQLAGSGDDSAAEKSVEEILKEAEDLVRETSHSFSALSEGRDLLKVPTTPDLVIRGQASDILPMPSLKSKSDRSGEPSKDKRSNRSSSAPPTARKTGERIAKGKGGRITGTKSSYSIRQTDLMTDKNGDNDVDSFRQNLLSAADRINSNIQVTSHSSSKAKDFARKEKTVTFNEDFVSSETEINNIPNTQVSSHILNARRSVSVESYLDKNSKGPPTGSSVLLNEASSRKRKMTEIVSISPPLIQHGDVVGTPEAIFQLIDDEVRNEIAAALKETSRSNSNSDKESNEPENGDINFEEEFTHEAGNNIIAMDTLNNAGMGLRKQPLSVVLEESSMSEASSEAKNIKQIERLKEELLKERNQIQQCKELLSTQEREHKKQLDSVRCKHEEEMFEVKKEVIVLNAKVGDLEKQQQSTSAKANDKEEEAGKERRIALLEGELQQQEQLMLGYQRENVKLCQEMKQLRVSVTLTFLFTG